MIDKHGIREECKVKDNCGNELNILNSRISSFQERLSVIVKNNESIRNFARKTAISEATIRQYLNAKSEPKMKHLIAIAEVGNVSIDWLAIGNSDSLQVNSNHNNSSAMSPLLQKWISVLDTVNDEDKEIAIKNIINKGFKTLLVDISNNQETKLSNFKQTIMNLLLELNEEDAKEILSNIGNRKTTNRPEQKQA